MIFAHSILNTKNPTIRKSIIVIQDACLPSNSEEHYGKNDKLDRIIFIRESQYKRIQF